MSFTPLQADRKATNMQLVNQQPKTMRGETFGKNVSNLIMGGKVTVLQFLIDNLFMNIMIVHLDMTSSSEEDMIICKRDGAKVVTPELRTSQML